MSFFKAVFRLNIIAKLLVVISIGACQSKTTTLFSKIPSSTSGITFNNLIIENDSLNPIDVTNIYNGGGVGIGDFNNDGLQDIYFTGNKVSNKLYLNKGDFKFKDITKEAGVDGDGRWCRGVSVVDINNDGWPDIYVSVSIDKDPSRRKNLLYINQTKSSKDPVVFKEEAEAYGLADTTHSTMAAFFDYDNDGDLDMYLVVNQILQNNNPAIFRPKITDGSFPSTGRLYRNDYNTQLKHPYFSNISREANILIEGYGHGVNICDINKDGWKDIFVTNDFNSNDLLYINNHDGTFSDKATTYFKHTSANGMGQDVIDINNDGLADVVELDMNPEDNYRKKMMMNANSYQNYQNSDYYNYQYQYVRNTLQLNEGPRVNGHDSIGDPIFSDIGFMAGIAETDWSWCPLVADFNNDGKRDIVITNGFPKDVTDHDFVAFRSSSYSVATKEYTLSQIPQVKLHNYAFENNGDLTFKNVTNEWGLTSPTFANGAAYADLDNDGDMDMIINNINDEADVYRNNLQRASSKKNYLRCHLIGNTANVNALGAFVSIYYNKGIMQSYEQTPYRGYLSSIQLDPQFGLDTTSVVDSIIINWPDNSIQKLFNVKANQLLQIKKSNSFLFTPTATQIINKGALFTDITDSLHLNIVHTQKDVIDFNIQKLLPHKFSEFGPALAVGDLNEDGIEDLVVGGNSTEPLKILLQQKNGSFKQAKNLELPNTTIKQTIDAGITLFDADGDGDLDMYVAAGGYENAPGTASYRDKFYKNNGHADFVLDSTAFPQNFVSKSCVRAADYDNDGDLDLFVAGRVDPWNYPKPVSSFVYKNESSGGSIKFTDVTSSVAKDLINVGMVCDATWTDFDNDGWQDLVLCGEWMPVTFLKNNKGHFLNISTNSGLQNKIGWFTSIAPADIDNDGDIDYVIGNLGLNSFYKASDQFPINIYAKDFNSDGNYDAITTLFLPYSLQKPERKEFPAQVRDDITKQIISFKSKFQNYKGYANATFPEMFTPEEMKGVLKYSASYFSNAVIKNIGNGRFEMMSLSNDAQFSCINGVVTDDFDGDGNVDILAVGNDYGTDVGLGRYDACNGLLLVGDGHGAFRQRSTLKSGFFVDGNGKSLVKIKNINGVNLIVSSQNKGRLKVYNTNAIQHNIELLPNETGGIIYYKNKTRQKREIGYGSSFLSQSGRYLSITSNVDSVRTLLPDQAQGRILHF